MFIYIFGLGHIGLPLACWIAMSENQVYGIDINPDTITSIKNGDIEMEEYYNNIHISKLAQSLVEEKKLNISTKFERQDKTKSIFIVSVGIADMPDGSKDISPIVSVIEQIKPFLVPDDLIILRSTLIPGTCENVILPIIEQNGLPFCFAYCPETMIETRAFEEFEENERVIGAMNDQSFTITKDFFNSLAKSDILRSPDIKTAEMAKIVQNIHRDVNIALANEISDAANILGVDFYELQKLVNTNPRVELLSAGPGVGGYCLPNALGYLKPALTGEKFCELKLCETARKQNDDRPTQVKNLIMKALKDVNKPLKSSTIAVSGLAMKDYCADLRFSPAIDLISLLLKEGAIIKAYDPLVSISYPFQTKTFEDCIENADCLVIVAKQKELIYEPKTLTLLMNNPPIVVDTRNVIDNLIGINLYKI
jgi:UDP-N-acetyl-D-mannosaminuronic acid dehydrogenase